MRKCQKVKITTTKLQANEASDICATPKKYLILIPIQDNDFSL
jgi:hypothetical protein